ncbi:MAG: DUF1631 domain-containing protein [Lysobacteraceae bacterium]
MTTPTSTKPANDPGTATLSTRSFPRRVRTLLEGIFEIVTGHLDRGLMLTLDGLEQQLFKMAEQSRGNDIQMHCLEALGSIKRNRFDLMPHYIAALEASLASIRDDAIPTETPADAINYTELSLVADIDMDESTLLHEIEARAEIRASFPLFLVSQRFGVMAGKPAMDYQVLPVSPAALCRYLRRACRCFELSAEHRLLLFRQFDQHLMNDYARLIEVVNTYLINQGVLPNLTYVPTRFRASPRGGSAAASTSPDSRSTSSARAPSGGQRAVSSTSPAQVAAAMSSSAFTGWPGESIGTKRLAADGNDIYTDLRELLRSSRTYNAGHAGPGMTQAAGSTHATATAHASGAAAQTRVASANDVQSVLGLLQRKPPAKIMVNGQSAAPTISHVKQDLMAQLRQITGDNPPPALAEEDTDTIELVSMLFDEIMKDVRPNSPAANLLTKLQVPLLRVALRDKRFFSHEGHPASQMLDAVAETGAYWIGEDGGDHEMMDNVHRLVERVTEEFDGDVELFNTLLADLNNHTQALMRRAEVAERRHVEAARGKEKLKLAHVHASDVMKAISDEYPLPLFTRALLNQAWTDVLALTELRHGDNSDEWNYQIETARQIASKASSGSTQESAPDAQQTVVLAKHIEQSLTQVGYHVDEAAAIGQRLSSGVEEGDEPSSRTEIAMKLKARARLGETSTAKNAGIEPPPLNAREQEYMETISVLPFGTWFEFVINEKGDAVRRRLSWYSVVSGTCLFINHRGQRVGDYTLGTLARAMANDQVRIVEKKKESMLASAMRGVVNKFMHHAPESDPAAGMRP